MPPRLTSPKTYKNHNHVVGEITTAILGNSRVGVADAQQALGGRCDSTETLKTISVPTLILVGEDDILTPPDLARSMQDKIPNSHLEIIPSAGHLSPLEQPERANAAIWTFLVEAGYL
jgi:3-oxoadipate enol-lactonase